MGYGPTVLRVGVTGHRTFDDVDRVTGEIDRLLRTLLERVDRTDGDGSEVRSGETPDVEVWSSLAEGADRLVVRRLDAMTPGRLVAVLPLDADDYRTDFADAASVAEFDALLAAAVEVHVTGPDATGERTSAYDRAGRAVADAVDVLVAVWDGRPARGHGGTAEIVGHARRSGREVVVVPVTRPEPVG